MIAALVACSLAGQTLAEQSVVRLIERTFQGEEPSYILAEVPAGRVLSSNWAAAERPVPAASLVKPFLAIAYGATHGFRFPETVCAGGCWLPRGHGRVGVVEALAQSCNVYFERLASKVPWDDVVAIAERFRIDRPPPGASLIGKSGEWKVAPLKLARAYCELARRRGEPGVDEALRGMAASAAHGTGNGAGAGALAKTGTAPCTHARPAPGDGFAAVLFPTPRPAYLLLVRVHGSPGTAAARAAGRFLESLRGGAE